MNEPSLKALEDLKGKESIVKIFCDLISFDTRSDPLSKNVPSTMGQLRLGASLVNTLRTLGFDAKQEPNGVIYCRVPASKEAQKAPSFALLAHMDTAPDASGAGVTPYLVEKYSGGGIVLKNGLVLDEKICKELGSHLGEDIIVTGGDTLLGGDDKAGVAVLMQLLHDLSLNPEIPHPELCVIFTVDEEIGNSADLVDLAKVNCTYGVTVDGCERGELDLATFNAYAALVEIKGRSVHTGTAYKVMHNACELACRFMNLLPQNEKPENTCGLEGFFHVHRMTAETALAKISLIVRDFDEEGMQKRLKVLQDIAVFMNRECGYDAVSVTTKHQYSNLSKALKEHPLIVDLCRKAYENAGLCPNEISVRGGTDGSNLSQRGLPCPNIFTGSLNCHGPYECLPVPSLLKAYETVRALIELSAEVCHEA